MGVSVFDFLKEGSLSKFEKAMIMNKPSSAVSVVKQRGYVNLGVCFTQTGPNEYKLSEVPNHFRLDWFLNNLEELGVEKIDPPENQEPTFMDYVVKQNKLLVNLCRGEDYSFEKFCNKGIGKAFSSSYNDVLYTAMSKSGAIRALMGYILRNASESHKISPFISYSHSTSNGEDRDYYLLYPFLGSIATAIEQYADRYDRTLLAAMVAKTSLSVFKEHIAPQVFTDEWQEELSRYEIGLDVIDGVKRVVLTDSRDCIRRLNSRIEYCTRAMDYSKVQNTIDKVDAWSAHEKSAYFSSLKDDVSCDVPHTKKRIVLHPYNGIYSSVENYNGNVEYYNDGMVEIAKTGGRPVAFRMEEEQDERVLKSTFKLV
jgi:hypothetical protein